MLLNAIKPELAFTQEFNRTKAGFTGLIQVIALLLFPLFWWISRRAKGLACIDSKLLHYQKILTRPFSAWLLRTVAVLVLVQFNGPILRLKLLPIFAWLPVMRLQSNRLHHQVGRWIYLTALCFVINLGSQWVASLPVIFRCHIPVGIAGQWPADIGNFSFTCGGIVLFCVSVLLSFWLAKTIRGGVAEDILPKMDPQRGVANSVSTMSYYALLMLGLTVALAVAGFHLSQLALVLGALSVGIGFGLQTVVNNFVSGLILMRAVTNAGSRYRSGSPMATIPRRCWRCSPRSPSAPVG